MLNLQTLRARGFHNSTHVPFTKHYRVKCDSCAALVINNTPTHETGCPEARVECRGCNTLVPTWRKYCEDCQ